MKKEDLKSGLFGYKKASVFRYIAEIEQEYSEKINEKEILAKKAEEQYLMQYAALEKEALSLVPSCRGQSGPKRPSSKHLPIPVTSL